jgi:glycosyltransferase involved in cell wall biosynthesis
MVPRLSILICHMPKRGRLLRELLGCLLPQAGKQSIEILIDAGDGTTGSKRNRLLDVAAGDYLCFVDDDDLVSGDYVRRILLAIESGPDVVGMEGERVDARARERFRHSIRYREWVNHGTYPHRSFDRNPNHLNPVRRELALLARFPDKTWGEDRDYSARLLPLLNSEVYLPEPIYVYRK